MPLRRFYRCLSAQPGSVVQASSYFRGDTDAHVLQQPVKCLFIPVFCPANEAGVRAAARHRAWIACMQSPVVALCAVNTARTTPAILHKCFRVTHADRSRLCGTTERALWCSKLAKRCWRRRLQRRCHSPLAQRQQPFPPSASRRVKKSWR